MHLYMVKYPGLKGALTLAISSGGWRTRSLAIAAFRQRADKRQLWKWWYRRGARVVPVRLTEIKN